MHTKNLAKYLLAELLFSSEDLTSTKGKKQKHIVLYRKQTQGKRLQDTILISCFGRSWSRNGKKIVSIKDNKLGKYFFPLQCLTELNLSIRGDLLLDTTKKSFIETIIYPNHNPKLSCAG